MISPSYRLITLIRIISLYVKKICHIFQFPHNMLCINNIKAGRRLRKRVIYQPICQPQQPICQPAVARAPRSKLKIATTKEHEATCKPA